MLRKLIFLVIFAALGSVILSSNQAFATINSFKSTYGNWAASTNWNQNAVPSSGDGYDQSIGDSVKSNAKAIIDTNVGSIDGSTIVGDGNTGTFELRSGGILNTSGCFCAGYNGGSAVGNVTVTGGSFTVSSPGWCRLGYNGDCNWDQSGGTVNLRYLNGWGYNGTVDIGPDYGGPSWITANIYEPFSNGDYSVVVHAYSILNVYGGVIGRVYNAAGIANLYGGEYLHGLTGGPFDIYGYDFNYSSATGLLTGFWEDGSDLSVQMTPLKVDVPDYSAVWAGVTLHEIPEPATLLLLGFGGLMVRRRKQ